MTYTLLVPLLSLSCGRSGRTEAGYRGDDLTGVVKIVRDSETKEAKLIIDKNMKWKLFAGKSEQSIDFSSPLAEGKGRGEVVLDVANDSRSTFQITTPRGDAIIAERHLPMAGAYNFRDLGGFRTQDGRYVKWGKIFRADDLYNLTEEDLTYLASIPLVSVVDFRAEQEIAQAPDRLPHTVKSVYAYSINPGSIIDANKVGDIAPEEAERVMCMMNELLVSEQEIVDQYRRFFEVLQSDENIPLVFHCSAGKDRTGMGAALILSALGVDRAAIIEDYLWSNVCLSDKYAPIVAKNPKLRAIFEVRAKYLEAGFAKIEQKYGSVDSYLRETLNVDIEAFRKKFLDVPAGTTR